MNGFFVFFNTENKANANEIDSVMRNFHRWAKLQDCAWFCCSNSLASEVRDSITDQLKQRNIENIPILVINVTDCGWATFKIPKNLTNWMRDRLKSDAS